MNNISTHLSKDTEGWKYEVVWQVTQRGPSPSLDVKKQIKVTGREYHKRDAEQAVKTAKIKLQKAQEALA